MDLQHASAPVRAVDRRTILKAGVWAAPVIASAMAAPAAAASISTVPPAPTSCAVAPLAWHATGSLSSDGSTGSSPVADGHFGTGWTPARAPGGGTGAYTQTGGAVAPTAAGWWSGAGTPATQSGFLSLDDHDNRATADTAPATVTASFGFQAQRGRLFQLGLRITGGAPDLGAQFLDIAISGAGQNQVVAQRYYGNKGISSVPEGFAAHSVIPGSETIVHSFTASSDEFVTLTYAFTVAYVGQRPHQNADIWVALPVVSNCTP